LGVSNYERNGETLWKVDFYAEFPDGTTKRISRKGIPTKEMATALMTKIKADSFEGQHFQRAKGLGLTVAKAWELYLPDAKLRKKS
jgi:hypothetical protein